jgi:hypothetical protein
MKPMEFLSGILKIIILAKKGKAYSPYRLPYRLEIGLFRGF